MALLALPRALTIGPLRAIEYAASEEAPVIVCLHGYGADARDLSPLAVELHLSRPARWLFPDAPLPMGPFMPGRMWFPIDEEALQAAQLQGKPLDFSGARAAGLDAAAQTVARFLAELNVPWSRLILGGFSQGSMVALEAALQAPESPRGLFILSGTLLDETSLRAKAPRRAGLPFFQSHGRLDPLLGYQSARSLEKLLRESGLQGTLRSFEGGHAIPPEMLTDLRAFLEKTASA